MELLSINQLFKYKIIKENYYKTEYKQGKTKIYNTRNPSKLKVALTFNKYGDRLNNVLIAKIFNEIPQKLMNFKKIAEMKINIKKWLASCPIK